ncbi:hypothetical protein ACIQNU_24080 [Streptomyces sp. NPDC091292]|uniref:hypothetical protein n=1 Tax=Streptomyces sp. NPDC091292 TaxID=3365991 RepID=UPI00380CCB0C
MNTKSVLLSFVPWVAFSLLVQDGANSVGFAALLGAVLAIWLIVRGRASGLKVIDAAGVVTFVALACAAFAGGDVLRDNVAYYGRGAATLVLALVMLASVPVLPFTEQYARESVPRQYWTSPVFRSVNRRISGVWGLAVLAMAIGTLAAGYLASDGKESWSANLVLNWVVTIVAVIVAIRYTRRAAARARAARNLDSRERR